MAPVGPKHRAERPDLGTDERLRAFEALPYAEHIAAASTCDVIRIAAAHAPHKPALVFLPSADPDEPGTSERYLRFFARVTRAANVFHGLGVRPGVVVSLLLPLLSESFHALFRG